MSRIVRILFVGVLTLLAMTACAQDKGMKSSHAIMIKSSSDYGISSQGAIQDIDSNRIRIFIPMGFGQIPELGESDLEFQEKHNVTYAFQGCLRYSKMDAAGYNQEVFKWLDTVFGNEWRKEIRNDVIGLKN